MSVAPLFTTDSGRLYHAGSILVCCVGLPARGKTHIARSVDRYLRWLGVSVKVFSLGDHRRNILGGAEALPHDYFATDGSRCEETEKLRKSVKEDFDLTVEKYFKNEEGQVAIYDANNGRIETRVALRARFEPMGVHVMFIENVCERRDVIERNIRAVKISSPDYKGWDPDKAVEDYWRRISDHEKTYEPIENPSFPYVKVINVGEKIVVNNVSGYLQSRIVFFLMNIHATPRTIYFTRSGPSRIEHSYKADSELSPLGLEYADRLAGFIKQKRRELRAARLAAGTSNVSPTKGSQADKDRDATPTKDTAFKEQQEKRSEGGQATAKRPGGPRREKTARGDHMPLTVWSSTRRRCIETTKPLAHAGYRILVRSQMNEMNPGVIDGMSVKEIKDMYPNEYETSLTEPYAHRYPRAESYHDLSVRLEPIIFEMEREKSDILIVGHSSVIRCLFAYLKGLPPQDIPLVSIKRGQLIEVTPMAYGVEARTHTFWTPSENELFDKLQRDEDAFHLAPESVEKADELNAAIAPLAI